MAAPLVVQEKLMVSSRLVLLILHTPRAGELACSAC